MTTSGTMKRQEHQAGTVLFEQGDVGDTMYVIESGAVELIRSKDENKRVLAILKAGEFFGEMAIVSQRPRTATAVVREDVCLLAIESATLSTMLQENAEIAARILRTMVSRLDLANRKLEILLWYSESPESVQGEEEQIDPILEIEPIEVRMDKLWANLTEVIIDRDYDAALDYLAEAERLSPEDPRIAKYRNKLATLSNWTSKRK